MRKLVYISMLFSILTWSCSQDEVVNVEISKTLNVEQEQLNGFIMSSCDEFKPDSIIKNVPENSDKYVFEDSHSELWVEESNLKATTTSEPLLATGYDIKEKVGTETTMYTGYSSSEPRLVPYVSYLVIKYQYKKVIQIPKNATLILPPDDIMSAYRPMGYMPGAGYKLGYRFAKVRTDNYFDTYYLITEIYEITHTTSGSQVAPADDPIYAFTGMRYPKDLVFKYQYTEQINW